MAKLNFDATNVDPSKAYEVLPEGKYLAAIKGSEMKKTKTGNGEMLVFTWTVLEGPHKGAQLWQRLNIDNPNKTAVKIAEAELSAVCHATGVMRPRDTVQLHDLPCTLIVKCKKREDNGELTNEIKGVEHKSACMNRGTPDVQDDADDADEAPPAWMQN
jgi:hypothetical protein